MTKALDPDGFEQNIKYNPKSNCVLTLVKIGCHEHSFRKEVRACLWVPKNAQSFDNM